MVGIVIVSHSARLAEGVCELADQMTQGAVRLAVAGGIDDPENPIGTDPFKVRDAVEQVFHPDGVVVLMDLGSALLSAEMALEFLEPAVAERVFLCEAPLVEGAVAAAVQAMIGAPVERVLDEARNALQAKAAQLGRAPVAPSQPEPPVDGASADDRSAAEETLELVVPNRLGLHARPAARLVGLAGQYAASLTLEKGDRRGDGKSLLQVSLLGARMGDRLRLRARGPDAAELLRAVAALAQDNFGDRDRDGESPVSVSAEAIATPAAADRPYLAGVPAAAGVAIGPVARYEPSLPPVTATRVADPAAEWERLQAAAAAATAELAALEQQTARTAGAAEAAIFTAHRLLLTDPALLGRAHATIAEDAVNAAAAWQTAVDATAAAYAALDDPYLRTRAADVEDVGRRVLRLLLAVEPPTLDFARPVILVAADLAPSDTARLDRNVILGLVTELGGATSHSAILARALGIPAVVGVGPALAQLRAGQVIALDGASGRVWPAPDAETLAELEQQRAAWLERQAAARDVGRAPAVTRDGRHIEVVANIGGPRDAAVALEYGAEGVGLFRTEFLFMGRNEPPDEEEQFTAYRSAVEMLGDRPLIIRTLDAGGDKPIPYLPIGAEENPFLGWRAIRYCLEMPAFFQTQLRAICRASALGRVKLMFPMIATVDEVRRARALLADAQQQLAAAGVPYDPQMEVGVMIEVPSAVTVADQLATLVDFFSIGTNDLTQYLLAADRGNARVAGLVDALQPAVLRAIAQTAAAAQAAGIRVAMCGELAGRPEATALLVGLGLDELSMSAPAIPAVKAAVRGLDAREAQALAAEVLTLDTVAAVRERLRR